MHKSFTTLGSDLQVSADPVIRFVCFSIYFLVSVSVPLCRFVRFRKCVVSLCMFCGGDVASAFFVELMGCEHLCVCGSMPCNVGTIV